MRSNVQYSYVTSTRLRQSGCLSQAAGIVSRDDVQKL